MDRRAAQDIRARLPPDGGLGWGARYAPRARRPPALRVYDLILLLDPAGSEERASEDRRDARSAIGAEAARRRADWGTRAARLRDRPPRRRRVPPAPVQGTRELIASLEHSLRIADGVVRHRIIKLPPVSKPVAASARSSAPEERVEATPASRQARLNFPKSAAGPAAVRAGHRATVGRHPRAQPKERQPWPQATSTSS